MWQCVATRLKYTGSGSHTRKYGYRDTTPYVVPQPPQVTRLQVSRGRAPVSAVSAVSAASAVSAKLNILSFALASDARHSHTPVSDQGECPPPPPALLTQDSMPRERRHLAGVTWEGGLVVLFFLLSRECSLDATGLLRFRTGDVLLGTSGVGCAYLLCLVPPVVFFWLYYRSLSGNHLQSIIYSANPSRRPLKDRVASGSNLQR